MLSSPVAQRWTVCPGTRFAIAVLVLALSATAPVGAAAGGADPSGDWPQYRGPQGSGIVTPGSVPEGGLARTWPEEGPVELWRKPFGSGFSSISIVGGVAFTMEAQGAEEAVVALDAATGEPRWRTVVAEPVESEFGRGPRSTPTVAGGKVYTVSSGSRLLCLDAKNGKILWDRDLTLYDQVPRFGYSPSPVVVDGMVVVDVGTKDLMDAARKKAEAEAGVEKKEEAADEGEGEESEKPEIEIEPQIGAVAAFDAATGELRWRGGFAGSVGYSTPVVAELGGVRQLVYSKFNQVAGLSFDGNILWSHETDPKGALPMPVILPGDVVFISTSDDHFGSLAVRVSRDESGSWSTEEVWEERLMRNHFNTSVTVGGLLLGFDNTTFKALDVRNGERSWAHRGFGKGSLVAAGDLLYVLGDDGTLALVHVDPAGYQEAGRVAAMTGKAWTSPSLSKGILLLRDHDEIVAYDVRAKAQVAASLSAEGGGPEDAEAAASSADKKAAEAAAGLGVETILARYTAARGGKDRWTKIRNLEMTGTYRAFSEISDFTLHRSRGDQGDLFRLEYHLFGIPAIRAVGPGGAWMQHAFMNTEAAPVSSDPQLEPYREQLLREAYFEPLLINAKEEGLTVEGAGVGEINGKAVVTLRVVFPTPVGEEKPQEVESEPVTETWYLDPETFLEVAVDSEIVDFTQGPRPFLQRAFYSDFTTVEGVAIPFQVDLEFNARFEGMTVEQAKVNGEIAPSVYTTPDPPPADPPADASADR